ncbi:MAG: lipopolysaccharide biosynthesis protein [Chloroflexota bacterium]|nr:lipopolysaccharide biosynthesis protein [Chloroflexota bacterium]
MLTNAGSLIAATLVTSLLGFVYWWVAARHFTPEDIGMASASLSVMALLGNFCILGLGTLLITELARQPGREGSLISTALLVVGTVAGCAGCLFAIIAPSISLDLTPLGVNLPHILVFGVGVSLTAMTMVLDQALIGLLRGELQLWRNTLFASAKLVILFLGSLWLVRRQGTTIYATWATGNIISLGALAVYTLFKQGWRGRNYLPQWGLVRKLGRAALQHHLLNLTLQAPTLMLPVLVTILLSARMNAWFYVSWMIASFVFLIPNALTTVLHAMNSATPALLAHKARMTISLAFGTSVLAICTLQVIAQQALSLFGSVYAVQATGNLHILLLAAFPLIIRTHYISICRIQDRIAPAMLGMLPGTLLELLAAALGGYLGGLSGLSTGWVMAIYVESLFMLRTVWKATQSTASPSLPTSAEAAWLLETPPFSAGPEMIWLLETSPLPAIWLDSRQRDSRNDHQQGMQRRKSSYGTQRRLKPPRLVRYSPYAGDAYIADKKEA